VSTRDVSARIARRTRRAGQILSEAELERLTAYMVLLGRWNARINITSLKVDQPNDEAVDRLIVEPVVAASKVAGNPRLAIDIGSGGGSPALPLRIMRPAIRYVLVESKVRKSAFLREAVRTLGLDNVEVENRRFEELLPRVDLHEAVDLITMRAVRLDRRLQATMLAFLSSEGHVFLFGSALSVAARPDQTAPLSLLEVASLTSTSNLLILGRS
jgi:16S rRNA (guanine527-N7)-methyltransferase